MCIFKVSLYYKLHICLCSSNTESTIHSQAQIYSKNWINNWNSCFDQSASGTMTTHVSIAALRWKDKYYSELKVGEETPGKRVKYKGWHGACEWDNTSATATSLVSTATVCRHFHYTINSDFQAIKNLQDKNSSHKFLGKEIFFHWGKKEKSSISYNIQTRHL